MLRALKVILVVCIFSPLYGAKYYWVGGTGNWTDPLNHWATTSGGSTFYNIVPSPTDTVYFDQNSYAGVGGWSVNINGILSNNNCENFICTNLNGSLTFTSANGLNIYGSLQLHTNVVGFQFDIHFKSNNNDTIQWIGKHAARIYFEGNGATTGQWQVLDATRFNNELNLTNNSKVYFHDTVYFRNTGSSASVYVNDSSEFHLVDGPLIVNEAYKNFNIYSGYIYTYGHLFQTGTFQTSSNATTPVELHFSTSRVEINQLWDINYYPVVDDYRLDSTYIIFNSNFLTNGILRTSNNPVNYNVVEFTQQGSVNQSFSSPADGCTYNKILFSSITPYLNTIHSDNTIDTLIVLGRGSTLALEGLHTQTIVDSLYINTDCSSLTELRTDDAAERAYVSSTKSLFVEYLTMSNIQETGTGASVAQNIAENPTYNALGNQWDTYGTLTIPVLYWIGGRSHGAGDGNWNNSANWSTTSGGVPQSCIPISTTDVYFDANSFDGSLQTVSFTGVRPKCHDMRWVNPTGNPTYNVTAIDIYGTLMFAQNMTTTTNDQYYFKSISIDSIYWRGQIAREIYFDGTGSLNGRWEVDDPTRFNQEMYLNNNSEVYFHDTVYFNNTGSSSRIYLYDSSQFHLVGGPLITNEAYKNFNIYSGYVYTYGHLFQIGSFQISSSPTTPVELHFSTSRVEINQLWDINYYPVVDDYRLDSTHIVFNSNFLTSGILRTSNNPVNYNVVEFRKDGIINQTASSPADGCTYNKILFSDTVPNVRNYTLNANNIIDSLIFIEGAGQLLQLEAGHTQTINNVMAFDGNGCYPMQIRSTVAASQATISYPHNFNSDFLVLRDINIGTGFTYNAGGNSVDNGNNTNWIYSGPVWTVNPFGDTSVIWVPFDDSAALVAQTFGNPEWWRWFDNTQDSIKYVKDSGNYSITLNYGVNCQFISNFYLFVNILTNDTIIVTDTNACVPIELPNSDTLFTCSGTNLTYNGAPINYINDSCIRIPAYSVDDTACIVSCDTAIGICDTTWIIFSTDTGFNLICNDTSVYINALGNATIDTSMVIGTLSPIATIDSVWLSKTIINCGSYPLDSVTIYARNSLGTRDSCKAYITIIDTVSPTISCSPTTIYTDINGRYYFDTSNLSISYYDNCGVDEVWFEVTDTSSINCNSVMSLQVWIFVRDFSGNIDSCLSMVTVMDTIPLAVYCSDTLVYLNSSGTATIDTSYVLDSVQNINISNYIQLSLKAFLSAPLRGLPNPPMNDNLRTGGYIPLSEPYGEISRYKYVNGNENINAALLTTTGANAIVDWILVDIVDIIDSSEVVASRSLLIQADGDIVDTNGNSVLRFENVIPGNNYLVKISHRNHLDIITANSYTLTATTTNLDFSNGSVSLYGINQQNNTAGVNALWAGDANADGIVSYLGPNTDLPSILNYVLAYPGNTFGALNYDLAFGYAVEDVDMNGKTKYNGAGNDMGIVLNMIIVHPDNITSDFAFEIKQQAKTSSNTQFNGLKKQCINQVTLSRNLFNCSDIGLQLVTIYVQDQSGNIDSCTSTVTVMDTINPTIICKDTTVAIGGGGNVIIDTSFVIQNVSDGCGLDSVWISQTIFTCIDTGLQVVMVYARDNSGNVDSCQSNVTIVNNVTPTLLCTDTTIYLDATGNVQLQISQILLSAGSNCGVDSVWLSDSLFTCSDIGTIVVKVYVRDASLNVDSCSANVTIADTINPTISCIPAILYINATGTLLIDTTGLVSSFSDNCGVDSVWVSSNDTSLTCSDTGIYLVTIYIRDNSGNIDSCQSPITILDTISPTIVCNSGVPIMLNASGILVIDTTGLVSFVSDNCGVDSVWVKSSDTLVDCSNIGTYNVTIYVSDNSGNIDSCVSSLTIMDNIPPIIVCTPRTVYLDATGQIIIDTTGLVGNYSDNCGVDSIWINPTDTLLTCADIGTRMVTLYARDINGNISSCLASVTVLDTINPVLMCQAGTVYLDSNGIIQIDTTGLITSISDNCGVDSVWISPADTLLNCLDTGLRSITIYIRDYSGNIDSCISTITVIDTNSPTAICRDTTIYLDATGNYIIDSSYIDNGTNGVCVGITQMILSQLSYTCADIGVTTVTLTVQDANGLLAQCQGDVTVIDSIAPQIVCPNDTNISITGSCNYIMPDYTGSLSFTDNCGMGGIVITQTPLAGSTLDINMLPSGMQQVMITVTDSYSNQDTCSFMLNLTCITNLIIPQFISPNDDGENDTWHIIGLENYPGNSVKIFNRWGEIVFMMENYDNSWYGQRNQGTAVDLGQSDSKIPSGTYFYIVDKNDGSQPILGYLQLMR